MNTAPKKSAALDVGRGGADKALFPKSVRNLLVSHHRIRVNRGLLNGAARFTHRLNTPFLRGENPSPAAEDLKRIRGRRLAGEPASGWGHLEGWS